MKKITTNHKTNWVNFLHFYQPPTSETGIIREAADRSYHWIISMLEKHPNFRFTFNMNSCLTELLLKEGYQDIINKLAHYLREGKLEIVDSLAYHPIAPLIPESEVIRQIKINQSTNQKHFGVKADGFFLPEMAYSEKIGKIIADLGYKWLILDEINLSGKRGSVDWHKQYQLAGTDLKIVFRSWYWSKDYVPRLIMHHLKENTLPDNIISATDGEIYGLRFKDWQNWLSKVLENDSIKTKTVSEYLQATTTTESINPVAGNWESNESEINKNPYALWSHSRIKLHKKLWSLAELAWDQLAKHPDDENYQWAEKHLEQGLASCTFWWASEKDFEMFNAPAWKPDEVEKGAQELVKVLRTLKVPLSIKLRAEKKYFSLKKNLWTKHWKKYG